MKGCKTEEEISDEVIKYITEVEVLSSLTFWPFVRMVLHLIRSKNINIPLTYAQVTVMQQSLKFGV
jgi:hypothetical protein